MKNKHDIRIDRSKLHPWLDYKLELLLKKCEKKRIYLIITEGFRTKDYQDALYAKGRTAPGNIVTNAKGSTYSSQHMWGIAFDIAINDSQLLYDGALIKEVAKIAKKIGLGWGGDWISIVDTPHFYLKKWGSTTSKLRMQYGTPNEFEKTWKKKVNKKDGLILWKNASKTKKIMKIQNGDTVKVMYSKLWYTKIKYKDVVGYVNKKDLL